MNVLARSFAEPPRRTTEHAPAPTLPEHDARELTAGGAQATITLDGQVYTLRITRAGKLLLTK